MSAEIEGGWALQESRLSLNSVREMSLGCNGFIKEFASSLFAGRVAKAVFLSANSTDSLFTGKRGENT